MKANELMIGDWVECVDSTHKKKVYAKVCAIEKGQTCVLVEKENSNWFLDISLLKPIPLKKAHLVTNGFEDIGDDTYQLEEKPCCFWVDFFNHQYGCEYDTSTHEYEDDEHRLKLYGIPSVHELQHALHLCGIEKEIELGKRYIKE